MTTSVIKYRARSTALILIFLVSFTYLNFLIQFQSSWKQPMESRADRCKSRVKKFFLSPEFYIFRNSILTDKIIFNYLASHFSKSCAVFDVGANVGKWTLNGKSLLKNCTFYSYEPVRQNFDKLKRVIDKSKLKNVNIYFKGVSDHISERAIIRGSGEGATLHEGSQNLNNTSEQISFVPVTTLDFELESVLKSNTGYSKVFVKIDVEGLERHVLRGMHKHLAAKKVSIVMWERNPEVVDRLRSKTPLVSEIKLFVDYGYRIYLLAQHVAIELFEDEIFNIFCSQAMNICYPSGLNCPNLYDSSWRSARNRCSPTINLLAVLDDEDNAMLIERIAENFPSECKG